MKSKLCNVVRPGAQANCRVHCTDITSEAGPLRLGLYLSFSRQDHDELRMVFSRQSERPGAAG